MDLDAWINDPPSESEDESVTISTHDDNNNQNLFYGDKGNYYHVSSHDSYSGEQYGYSQTKTYIEPTVEELREQREKRKQSEQMNPFYIKDSTKGKVAQQVRCTEKKFPK